MATTSNYHLTPETLPKLLHNICVKKGELENPVIVDSLKKLLNDSSNRNDSLKNRAILEARKRILEQASDIYLELEEDELHFQQLEEIESIELILNTLENERS